MTVFFFFKYISVGNLVRHESCNILVKKLVIMQYVMTHFQLREKLRLRGNLIWCNGLLLGEKNTRLNNGVTQSGYNIILFL